MLSETALLNKITEPEDHAEPYSLCRFFAALSRFQKLRFKNDFIVSVATCERDEVIFMLI